MIRIALISDIHFGRDGRGDFRLPNDVPLGKLNTEEKMGADLVDSLKELAPEYLFVAGDLTSVGSPAEYYYCEQKLLGIAKDVGIAEKKIIWCVGNHDNDWCISKLFDNYSKDHAESYNADVEKISIKKYSKIAASVVNSNIDMLPSLQTKGICPASGIYEDDKMIVFVLNSASECMHNLKVDHGKITREQLNWFEKQLLSFEDDKRWKIVLLHHHPFNYSYPNIGLDLSLLSDGSEFQGIAGRGGVHLVLHGHRHHSRCKTQNETGWKNPISFVCAGSLSVSEKGRMNGAIPNMFHIIELDEVNVGQLYLKSFEYLPGSGWLSSKKRGGVVPIDSVMRLGRIVSREVMVSSIEDMAKLDDPVLSYRWDEINENLQFNPCDEINALVEKTLEDRFVVRANLPDNLTLKRKRGKK